MDNLRKLTDAEVYALCIACDWEKLTLHFLEIERKSIPQYGEFFVDQETWDTYSPEVTGDIQSMFRGRSAVCVVEKVPIRNSNLHVIVVPSQDLQPCALWFVNLKPMEG